MLSDKLRGADKGWLSPGYHGLLEFGTLTQATNELALPTRPWRNDQKLDGTNNGNIPDMVSNMGTYDITDTSSTTANVLKWHLFVDPAKRYIYICDRVLVVNCNWNDLNLYNWISGKFVEIDGVEYWCRSLTGGVRQRNNTTGISSYDGGLLPNEWDRYVMNNADEEDPSTNDPYFPDAPIPEDDDWDTTSDVAQARYTAAHNQAWNWAWVYSWCSDTYHDDSRRAYRGLNSARRWSTNTRATTAVFVGWRPCLVL